MLQQQGNVDARINSDTKSSSYVVAALNELLLIERKESNLENGQDSVTEWGD